MKRLYWYQLSEKEVMDGVALNHTTQLGGLGLTTSKTTLTGGKDKEDNQLLGMLSENVVFKFDEKANLAERLVTVKNLNGHITPVLRPDDFPATFITTGEDYFSKYSDGLGTFAPFVDDKPIFTTTKDGEKAMNWDVNLIQIVPLYDGELDKEYGYWEMFEEEGYIYGLDRRTGNIYDVIHIEQEIVLPFNSGVKKMEMWVISNDDIKDPEDALGAIPIAARRLSDDYAQWVRELAINRYEWQMNAIKRYVTKVEQLTVERLK